MNIIKDLRNLTGLTQKEFAEALGIPKRTIENWEQGKRECPEYVKEGIKALIEKYKMEANDNGREFEKSIIGPVSQPNEVRN